jgi:hypothetical protein
MRLRKKFFPILFVGLSLFVFRFIASAGLITEDWYSILIAGQKAGFMFQRTEPIQREGRPLLRTVSETKIVLNRLGTRVEMLSSAEYVETESGRLVEVESELKYSALPVRTEARVEDGRVVMKTFSGGSAQERKIPFSGELLGPEGMRLASERGLKKPGDSVTFQSFLPELSQLVLVTQTLIAVERLPGPGPQRAVLRVEESYAAYPQKRTVWLDRQGRTLRSSDTSPFGELAVRLTTKEEALDLSQAGNIPAEQFRNTMIRSNIRLPQARLIDSVTLRLEKKSTPAEIGWPAFDASGQTILNSTGEKLTLKIERPPASSDRPATDKSRPPSSAGRRSSESAAQMEEMTRSNLYLNSDDALLKKTVDEALAGENDPFRRALLLRNWVSGHMQFDLGIAFAPSSEIIRNLKGTCAEYAILLAAMLRAAGIPSRFLMGYVYLNGIWGGHAWVEAYISGLWLPFDAAVIGPGVADAARFALASSSLNEGLGELLAGGQSLLGNIAVTVLGYSLRGKKVEVDPRAPLSIVLGDQYLNTGLGMRIRKPAGFVFTDLDKTWPDRTLLAMKGPEGETLRIYQDQWRPGKNSEEQAFGLLESLLQGGDRSYLEYRGRLCPLVKASGKAAAAIPSGVDVWLIQAEGGRALELLKTILSSSIVGPLWPVPETFENHPGRPERVAPPPH